MCFFTKLPPQEVHIPKLDQKPQPPLWGVRFQVVKAYASANTIHFQISNKKKYFCTK